MDDGCKLGKDFKISTNSYTKVEVELLINTLKSNFNINSSYHIFGKDQYTIYIKSDSMKNFKSLVTPYFHNSMLYKLN